MEASLLVIMLDWFKAVKSYEWIQKKKKKYVPVCTQSVVLLQYLIPTFSTSAIVIDNQCSTGLIRGFFVTNHYDVTAYPYYVFFIQFLKMFHGFQLIHHQDRVM